MALQKQGINISFGQGLDTKSDAFQVEPGNFLELENSVFSKFKQLTKRNGFATLSTLSDATAQVLTTFKSNLVALGSSVQALIPGTSTWVSSGTFKPIDLSTISIVKTSTNQSQADSAISPNDLVCAVYTDQVTNSAGVNVPTHKYTIVDRLTGQTIVAPTALTTNNTPFGTPRVYVVGYYFIIAYMNYTGGVYNLNYVAIPYNSPTTSPTSPVTIGQVAVSASSLLASTPPWDALSFNDKLYVAYNTTSGGQQVKLTYVQSTLGPAVTPTVLVGSRGQIFNLAVDSTTNHIWVTWYDYVGGVTKSYLMDVYLQTVSPPSWPVTSIAGTPGTVEILNLAVSAYNGIGRIYYEVKSSYTYNPSVPSNTIYTKTILENGTVGSGGPLMRSVGLASKAFILDSVPYFLVAYQSSYQSGYYLVDYQGKILSKLAYTNGGGYIVPGALPNVSLQGVNAYIPYLYKSTITPVNKETNVSSTTQVAGIYAQLGVNLATFDLTASNIKSSEIGNNLNLTGGFVTAYDGQQLTEQGFFVYPDNVEGTNPAQIQPVGSTTINTNTITITSGSTTNIVIGMNITGTNIPASTTVTSISGSTITISQNATNSGTGITFTFTGNIANADYYYVATYEWSDAQGNLFRSAPSIPVKVTTSSTGKFVALTVPTLRLTYKIASPVKIVVYRWSQAQQIYYQVTSVTRPILNDTSVDYLTIVDYSSDAQILGNSILYTTGGTLENVSPPAANLMTLFNNRLWLLDSENRNLLWYSKPVFDNTPVEMSDLMTMYIAPTTAAQGSTGIITAMSPMDDKLVIFKKNAVGYINGQGPDAAGNYNQYSEFVLVNTVVGCDQPQSIVLTPNGLMFQSGSGIWLLGRDLSTQYIGSPVERYTQDAVVLSAINVPNTTQVRFTLDSGITLMYDYFFGQWGSFTNIPAVSSTIYENLHTYLYTTTVNNQLYARVSQETPGEYSDNSSPVLMKFKTAWMNFAGVQGFERFYQMYILGKYITPFKLNVELAYDYNASSTQSTNITPQEYGGAWGDVGLWGGGNTWGNTPEGNVFQARLFPQVQKCESFQITVSEVFDSSFGTVPGAGLTLSGMNLVVGMKKGYRTSTAAKSFG